jgi:diguanylate cyclase (GGDEF)-like protein
VALRHGDALLGMVRLSDTLDGGAFGEMDRAAAEKFAAYASQAISNAMRFRSLERRSFRDPITRAYTSAYLEDIVRNEIQKASRFGRSFSLVRLQLEPLEGLRRRWPEAEFAAWLESLAAQLGRALRATDQLASESEDRFCAFLPETHAVGAGVLKYRMRAALERAEALTSLPASERPAVLFASATFPVDGVRFENLRDTLDARIVEHRASLARRADLLGASFRQLAERLLAEAKPGRAETAEQAARFLFSEIAQRPEERGLLFVSPGAALSAALRSGLERVRGLSPHTEIVLLADRPTTPTPGLPVTWVTPLRAGTSLPFLVYYGEGPSYALLRDDTPGAGRVRLFHTHDRALVEELAFGLGRDLGIPIGESA